MPLGTAKQKGFLVKRMDQMAQYGISPGCLSFCGTFEALDWSNCRRLIASVEPFKSRCSCQLLAKANHQMGFAFCAKTVLKVCIIFVDVSMFEYVSFLSSSRIRHRDVQTSSGEHDRIISVNGVSEPPTAVALQLTYLVWFNEGIQGESLPTGLFIEKEHRFSVEHVLKDIKCRWI